jgi:hypothetical protein
VSLCGWFRAPVLLVCVLAPGSLITRLEGQVARPGAARLNAQTVVLSVLPDSLDGVHLEAKLRPGKEAEWTYIIARFDPAAVSTWASSVEQLLGRVDGAVATVDTARSPLLLSLGSSHGLALFHAPGPGVVPPRLHWLFHRLDGEPVALAADIAFSRAAVRALRDAASRSAIDSAAFLNGLVVPLTQLQRQDSLDPAPRYMPTPKYPPKFLLLHPSDGLVTMRFVIDEKGQADMSTFEALWVSHEAFVPSVREAIFRAKYRPARFQGKPVRRRVYQTVRFVVGQGDGVWQ